MILANGVSIPAIHLTPFGVAIAIALIIGFVIGKKF